MFFQFTAIDQQGQLRPFFMLLDELETGLDVVSGVAANGDVIVEVQLIDEGQCIPLPPEAFDGERISTAIEQLQSQWQAVLEEQANLRSTHSQLMIELNRRQHQAYQTHRDRLQFLLQATEEQLEQIQASLYDERYRTRLLARIEQSRNYYQRQMDQVMVGYNRVGARLAYYADSDV